MGSGQWNREHPNPNSRKNRWLRIQELSNDIETLDDYIENRKFGARGTLAMMSLCKVLRRTICQLEKGGL